MIPTAEEFLESKGLFNDKAIRLQNMGMTSSETMIEFAKLHVESALKAAVENTETTLWQNNYDLSIVGNRADYIINHIPIKDVIINSYPISNIK